MRRSHDFPPYHFGIKARKPQSAEAGICSHQWHRAIYPLPCFRYLEQTAARRGIPDLRGSPFVRECIPKE